MRGELQKRVRDQFRSRLEERLPQFRPDPDAEVPAGSLVFARALGSNHTAYLLLFLSTKSDEFTVECAWSTHGRFPAKTLPRRPLDAPDQKVRRDLPVNGNFRFYLANLWHPRADPWWDLNRNRPPIAGSWVPRSPAEIPIDAACANVDPLVDDAIRAIVEHAMPYFHRIAEEYSAPSSDRA